MAKVAQPRLIPDRHPARVTDGQLASWDRAHLARVGEPAELDITERTHALVGVSCTLLPLRVQVLVLLPGEIGVRIPPKSPSFFSGSAHES